MKFVIVTVVFGKTELKTKNTFANSAWIKYLFYRMLAESVKK